jgi:DNA-binding NtrC family response regulator
MSARILIVDDNVALAENLAEVLALEGYRTDVAASAEEALASALSADLSVVVTDFRLPGLDGAELVTRLRERRLGMRFVVISGHTDDGTIDRAREAGARFFPKPLDLEALRRFLRDGVTGSA